LTGAAGTVACGELIAPTMRAAVARFNAHTGAALEVIPVENVYLGSEINVSGLLSGQDLLVALARHPDDAPLYISDRMVSQRTGTLLDDRTVECIALALGRPVVPAADLSDVARDLRARGRNRTQAAA
jgi:NifB/MoaA-like Fe-S oxidoreductase